MINKILVLNSIERVSEDIKEVIEGQTRAVKFETKTTVNEAIDYLHYELPELIIVNFADIGINLHYAMEQINEDLWLNNGGLIILHAEHNEDEFLKQFHNSNILGVINHKEIKQRLPNVLKILLNNYKMIFQREIPQKFENSIEGSFSIDNNPFDVQVYANLISLFLYNTNLIDITNRSELKHALVEIMMNAIEHGNCEIGFDAKTDGLFKGLSIYDLIEEKMKEPQISRRKVTLSFNISKGFSHIAVEDEGRGFDWQSRIKAEGTDLDNSLAHGRGILMARNIVQNLRYNEKGNITLFEVVHQLNKSNLRPRIFQGNKEVDYKEGDIVFQKGETSNFLAYIVSGTYHVLDDTGKKFADLNPNDIFIGEMAFLLGNERTATIQTHTPGTLVQLTKEEFVSCIRKYPYYGLFLARLLAQKMNRMNNYFFSSGVKTPADFIQSARDFINQKNYMAAVREMKLAYQYHPEDQRILYLLGKYLAQSREFEESLEYMNLYIQKQPQNPDAYVLKAHSLYKIQDYRGAQDMLEKSLELKKSNPSAFFLLTKTLLALNEKEEARKYFARLEQIYPEKAQVGNLRKYLN